MPLPLLAPNKTQAAADHSIEISIKGRWVRVPALDVNGNTIVVKGRWIKVAFRYDEDYAEKELEHPELCVSQLKARRSREPHIDIFTFTQKLPETLPKYKYPMEWESIAAVRTTSLKDWWENLPQETRKNVRRSQKRGVVVRVKELDGELIRGIIGVNNDSPVRQRKDFVHFGKTFDQVKYDQSSFLDRSDFICAYLGDELIGFLKIAYCGEIASIVQLLPKASHNDKRPANALLAKAVELCEAKGVLYLTYAKFNYGNKGASPLRDFKIRNGFEEILMPRFYAPLTTWGTLCMKLNLHHGLLGILPHRLITMGLSARTEWHNLKQSISRCSSVPEQPNSNRQTECSNPPAGSNTLPAERLPASPDRSHSAKDPFTLN